MAVGGVELAAVHGQGRRRDRSGGDALLEFGGDPAGFHRRRLAGVAQHPQLPAGTRRHRGEDGVHVPRRGLRDLIEYHHRARRQRPVGEVEAKPGDRRGRQPGVGQFGDGFGGRGHRDHRATVGGGGVRGGKDHGGLAVPGGGEHRPHAATVTAQRERRRVDQRRGGRRTPRRRRSWRGRSGRRVGRRAGQAGRGWRLRGPGGRRWTSGPAANQTPCGAARAGRRDSDAKNSVAVSRISSTVSRPADRAAMCSTTSGSANRGEWAHSPVSSSTSTRTISSNRERPSRRVAPAHPRRAPGRWRGRRSPPRTASGPPAGSG